MSDIIGSIGQAISLAKRLREVNRNIGDAEFSNILADLNIELAETKLTIAELMEKNAQLQIESQKLKDELQQINENNRDKVTFLNSFVFENDPEGKPRGRPHCRTCYKNHAEFHAFARKEMTIKAECTNCRADVHFRDAELIMTPKLYEQLIEEQPHLFS